MVTILEIQEQIDNLKAILQRLAIFSNETPTTLTNNNAYSSRQVFSGEWRNTPIDNTTRDFIKLEQSFFTQMKQHEAFFDGQNQYALHEKMKLSSELLLYSSPDAISLQLTEEGSIFYTVRKNEFYIYLQHYLIDEFDETDEAIVSIYNRNEKLLDYGGTLEESIRQLNGELGATSILLPEFA